MAIKFIVLVLLLTVSQASVIYRRPRIIGGHDVKHGEFPYQVSLQFGVSKFEHFCGGTIINEYWILTAVHCVQIAEKKADSVVRIVAGKHDLNATEPSEQIVFIEKTYKHENYTRFMKPGPNDIALIKLTTPLKFTDHVAAVHLPKKNAESPTGVVILSGWGAIADNGTNDEQEMPKILQTAEVDIIDLVSCRKAVAGGAKEKGVKIEESMLHEIITETNICTGPLTGGMSFCRGDSGGPLITTDKDGNSELVGITSWGAKPCGTRGTPAVHVRVSSFVDWIHKKISENYYPPKNDPYIIIYGPSPYMFVHGPSLLRLLHVF